MLASIVLLNMVMRLSENAMDQETRKLGEIQSRRKNEILVNHFQLVGVQPIPNSMFNLENGISYSNYNHTVSHFIILYNGGANSGEGFWLV